LPHIDLFLSVQAYCTQVGFEWALQISANKLQLPRTGLSLFQLHSCFLGKKSYSARSSGVYT